MELKDLEPYIKDDFQMEICGEVFKLGTTDDMEIPENEIEAVWCSDKYTIYATPTDNFGLMVQLKLYNPDLEDDEPIAMMGSMFVQIKAFNQYCNFIKETATKMISEYEQKLKDENDPIKRVERIIASGRALVDDRETLTQKYKRDVAVIDWLIRENGKELTKAMNIRDGDEKQ